MEYIIKTVYKPNSPYAIPRVNYYERETLEDAKACADDWAAQFTAFGLDYDVAIYEITNY